MTRDAGDALDVGKPLGRYALPHRHGATGEAESGRHPAQHSALGPDQVHAIHAGMLRQTERVASSHSLRTAYTILAHAVAMDLATRLRTRRMEAGLSQRDVAKLLKVSASAVAQWESGTTSPRIDKRNDIAKLYKIPLLELLPEAAGLTEVSVRDPVTVLLVQRFQELPHSVREAVLTWVVASADAYHPAPPTLPAPKPARKPRRKPD